MKQPIRPELLKEHCVALARIGNTTLLPLVWFDIAYSHHYMLGEECCVRGSPKVPRNTFPIPRHVCRMGVVW